MIYRVVEGERGKVSELSCRPYSYHPGRAPKAFHRSEWRLTLDDAHPFK